MATELSKLMMLHDRGVHSAFEAACALGQEISDREGNKSIRGPLIHQYEVYENHKRIAVGTAREISKKLNVDANAVYGWCSRKRVENGKDGGRYAVKVEENK